MLLAGDHRSSKAIVIFLMLVYIIYLILMPISIGGAYQANMIVNIYLPNLGLDSNPNLDPSSIILYIVAMNIFSLILGVDTVELISIVAIILLTSITLSYLLLTRSFSKHKHYDLLIGLGYPLIILGLDLSLFRAYTLNFTLPLCLIMCYVLLNIDGQRKKELFIVGTLSSIALGYYWHTFYTITFLIVLYFFVYLNVYRYLSRNNLILINLMMPLLFGLIFIAIWLFLRESVLSFTLFNPNLILEFSDFFSKGSFTGQYSFQGDLPTTIIDPLRYIGYIVTYVVTLLLVIKIVQNYLIGRSISESEILLVSVFSADITFQILYFIASHSISPKVLIFLLFPMFVLTLKYDNLKNIFPFGVAKLNLLRIVIIVVATIPLILTSLSGIYIYTNDYPEYNIPKDTYASSINWNVNYLDSSTIISDTHTLGHYLLSYIVDYQRIFGLPICNSIGYKDYHDLVTSRYRLSNGETLIINNELAKKHVVLESLNSWNKFEPLSYTSIRDNPNLKQIFSDGKVVIYRNCFN